jgi:prophage maintenance system killer protein
MPGRGWRRRVTLHRLAPGRSSGSHKRTADDGNRRTGLACAIVSLAINGRELHVPASDLYSMTMAIANNQGSDEEVAAYFRRSMIR